ncbi:uncharacterized protein JCM15063_000753 [Sporobolomyces koalae]|uniref:uncharacterized protein n=1 Tax=Sporobolomyces koalae TaxID=500713 RepID=UPI00317A3D8B
MLYLPFTSGQAASRFFENGFSNPISGGGKWLTWQRFPWFSREPFSVSEWNNWWAGGEPLNVVVSSLSDARIHSLDGFLDYCASLRFSKQCFQWVDGDSLQAANLGDGNELVNQTTIMRYNYDDPVFGTCSESLQGGNHFRVFQQNGPLANSSAWFLAVSKEHNLAQHHDIIANGYDLGRDDLVELATNPAGTRSPISKTLYMSTVSALKGPAYFGDIKPDQINHIVAIDGRIALLTVKVVEEGNGKFAEDAWFTSIRLSEFLIFIGTIVFLVIALGVFLCVHYRHRKQSVAEVPMSKPAAAGKSDEYPLLDRQVV